MARRMMSRLFYFTVEDESMLAEAFARLEDENFAVTYKVMGTEDVFVTTAETRDKLDGLDVPYNLLAEEEADHIAVFHTPLSREELGDHEEHLKALALAYRSIAMACVGINGETNLGFDLSEGTDKFTYFTAPAGHTFIWRMFTDREEAHDFLSGLTLQDPEALAWVEGIPLDSSDELTGYH